MVLIHFSSSPKFIAKAPAQTLVSGGPGIIHSSALGVLIAPQFKWRRKDGPSFQDKIFIQLTNGSLKVEPTRR